MADLKWVGEPAKVEEHKKLGVTPPRANMGSINEGVVLEMNDRSADVSSELFRSQRAGIQFHSSR